jgi:hypothetical protein
MVDPDGDDFGDAGDTGVDQSIDPARRRHFRAAGSRR